MWKCRLNIRFFCISYTSNPFFDEHKMVHGIIMHTKLIQFYMLQYAFRYIISEYSKLMSTQKVCLRCDMMRFSVEVQSTIARAREPNKCEELNYFGAIKIKLNEKHPFENEYESCTRLIVNTYYSFVYDDDEWNCMPLMLAILTAMAMHWRRRMNTFVTFINF